MINNLNQAAALPIRLVILLSKVEDDLVVALVAGLFVLTVELKIDLDFIRYTIF